MSIDILSGDSDETLKLLEAFGVPTKAYNGWITKFSFEVEAGKKAVVTVSYDVPTTSVVFSDIRTIVDKYNLTKQPIQLD